MTFFSPPSEVTPAGIFSDEHLIYTVITFLIVIVALIISKKATQERCLSVIKVIAVSLTVIETIKIVFVLLSGQGSQPNSYIPLYFCSIEIYASLVAAFARGKLQRVGEVFLMTGGVVGGIFFIIYPLTSLSIYPAFHIITVQSYFFHALMTYVGLLMVITKYRTLHLKDAVYHVIAVSAVSLAALIFNIALGTNLMFLSQNYPGTFIEPIYNALPLPIFTLSALAIQALGPFYFMLGIYKLISKVTKQ